MILTITRKGLSKDIDTDEYSIDAVLKMIRVYTRSGYDYILRG
jgi:hypothetical protein